MAARCAGLPHSLKSNLSGSRCETGRRPQDTIRGRHPQLEATELASRRTVGLGEAFESPRQKLGRDAGTRIGNADRKVAVALLYADADLTARGSELNRIGQQIPDDLLDAIGIAVELEAERRSDVHGGRSLCPDLVDHGRSMPRCCMFRSAYGASVVSRGSSTGPPTVK
jgi:hypothetical protein